MREQIIDLYYNKGQSHQQIAEQLSIPVGVVRSTIFVYRKRRQK